MITANRIPITGKAGVRLPASTAARLALIAASALVALWFCASLWFPFGWDQGEFASIGDVIVRGGMPYRDGWDMKGPLAYYMYALAQWIFGRHMWSIRMLDIPLLLAGMAALASLTGRFTSRLTGWWAAIVFALWISSLTWFHTAQPDGWAANFIILAVALLLTRKPSTARLACSGALIGLAASIKPLYIGFLAVPLIYLAVRPAWKLRTRLAGAATAAGAALAPPLLALAWFAYRGALHDLIEVHLLYTLGVYSGSAAARIRSMIGGPVKYWLTGIIGLALPVIAIGLHELWHKSRDSAVTITTWAMVALGCVAAQDKFYKYHWIPLFPPVIILGAIGCYKLWMSLYDADRRKAMGWLRLPAIAALLLTALVVCRWAVVPASSVVQWLQLVTGHMPAERYYAAHASAGFVAADDMKAAQYIRERTRPTDGVTVWGINALVLFLSGRPNPTRFVFAMPLTEGGPHSPRDAYRREYIRDLGKNPPVYFVAGLPWGSLHKDQALRGFPELEELLHQRYSLETRIGGLDLYRRRDPAPRP